MEPSNGTQVATMPEPKTYTRQPLTDKQQEFFRRAHATRQQIEMQMNGALSLICTEHDLRGKVTLSDDMTELILEAE